MEGGEVGEARYRLLRHLTLNLLYLAVEPIIIVSHVEESEIGQDRQALVRHAKVVEHPQRSQLRPTGTISDLPFNERSVRLRRVEMP